MKVKQIRSLLIAGGLSISGAEPEGSATGKTDVALRTTPALLALSNALAQADWAARRPKRRGQARRGTLESAHLNMKSNQTSSILLGILAISALASVILCIMWVQNMRQFRGLQQQIARVQQNRVLATQLAGELVEYSKRNPAIDPLLETFRIKEKSAPAPSAAKPTR